MPPRARDDAPRAAEPATQAGEAPEPRAAEPSRAPSPPRRSRGRLRGWLVQALIATCIFGSWALLQRSRVTDLLPPGTDAPALRLEPLAGGPPLELAALRGKTVLLAFWATYCGACLREISALNAVYRELAPDEALVAVETSGEDPATLRAAVAREGIEYPVYVTTPEAIERFQVTQLPTTYVIAGDGRIAERDLGDSTRWGLRARLDCAR